MEGMDIPFPRLIEFEQMDIRLFETSLVDIVQRLGDESGGSDFFSALLSFCQGTEPCQFFKGRAVGALFMRSAKSHSVLVRTDAEPQMLKTLLNALRHPSLKNVDPSLSTFSETLGVKLIPLIVGKQVSSPPPPSIDTLSVNTSSSVSERSPSVPNRQFAVGQEDAFHQSRSSLLTDEPEELITGASHKIVKAFLNGDKSFTVDEDF